MDERGTGAGWGKRIALGAGIVLIFVVAAALFISRADGPFFIFQGGPFRSGELVAYEALDWSALDDRTELELELVGAEMCMPGDNVQMNIDLGDKPIAMEEGLRFAVREGGRTVGSGVVTKVIE